ncbi:M20/M25/M40 family metallo-hydrolase [Olivibacter sitiensis]|uniref:M20/M25/M40 family metallo-hydrolase n=1 Tax=Olivibacter sitiensis TaxID=376470 RepID=UPI0004293192|nr:M20/M25/M40 family metallo-hydrolase [Olivibacter sitiensis]
MKNFLLSLSFISLSVVPALKAQEKIDLSAIDKIRQIGFEDSKVMHTALYLTDMSGPRLSNSPGLKRAQEWAVKELKSYGLSNVALEPWGDFGRGWVVEKSYLALKAPYYNAMIAVPKAWSTSTNGLVSGNVIVISANKVGDLAQYKGKLAGKIVMTNQDEPISQSFDADQKRYTEEQLKEMADFDPDGGIQRGPMGPGDMSPARRDSMMKARQESRAFAQRLAEFLKEEQVSLVLSRNARAGSYGTVFTSNGEPYAVDAATTVPSFEVSPEDYLRILRMVKEGVPVVVEAELKTSFLVDDIKGYNVIAELPGSDPKLKEEIVMLGGHLDSWHGATGATDNAAGSAVMMEAIRILKASGLKPKRTIRIALWSSEEQGLHGSRNYVKNHFGTLDSALKPEQEKISAYYNLDNGAGKIRGIYAQMNKAVVPIFKDYLAPFADLEATAVTLRNTGSTDHVAFDGVGIPGFQFIQDPLAYGTRTHHTNQDTYDRLIDDDLKQAATIIAAFVYNTAQRADKLPRKPLPAKE